MSVRSRLLEQRVSFPPQICANDDLVAKKFAYYRTKYSDSSRLDEEDRFPVMLSSSIFTQTGSNRPAAQIPPPLGKQTHHLLEITELGEVK